MHFVKSVFLSGYPLHRVNGKRKSLLGKTQGIWKFGKENIRNLVCSSCKFPDSKGNRYFEIAAKILKKNLISLPSQFCVCNSHKSCKWTQEKFAVRQGKTGNLKMQFDRVPWVTLPI